jgi:uncharacterized protein (DUF433 family)
MRDIIRDPAILDGRWHFATTTIPIADVRNDFNSSSPEQQEGYKFPNLSPEEIRAALGFAFPVVRKTDVEVHYASVVVHCECGEDTPHATSWPTVIVECVCKREWRVTMLVEPVPPGTKAALSA